MQKNLNINIINYKYFPGKIIFELNGIGKEYNIDGFVKEKIKEYNEDGELVFEGEYLNGERNGEGKEYYKSNKLKFEGNYLNGKINGKGKEYYFHDSTLFFDGEYLYGYKKSGKLFIEEHLEYEGDFLFDKKWHGKGYDREGNIIYELIYGNGKVEEYNEEGNLIYESEYLNGKRNGEGKEFYNDVKLQFEGEYLNGERNGKGNIMKMEN